MERINLRKYYAWYQEDCWVEVTDEVAQLLQQMERQEQAVYKRICYHKAWYSLEFCREQAGTVGWEDAWIQQQQEDQLRGCVGQLSQRQRCYVYQYYYEGKKKSEIALAEQVSPRTVYRVLAQSIGRLQAAMGQECEAV